MKQVPVLIIGGGPVGLALAADLGSRGIECLLVEQGDGSIFHPRANTVNSRTMEFCRRWGIADRVRNSGTPPDFPLDIVYATGLQGYEIARINRPSYGGAKPIPTTPERSQRCNQIFFDPIMRDLAGSFPAVTLRYQCRLESFTETSEGVVATVRDVASDRVETIGAKYLVACCGGHSPVPRALGVQWQGTSVLSYNLNVFLRIPELWKHHGMGKTAFYFFVDREGRGPSLIEIDGNVLWRLGLNYGTERVDPKSVDIDSMVKRFVGASVPYEVISVLPWTCRSIVADCWRKGPVFLAGDAVHQHSPSGGFGMNTGFGDAVDLSWKLSACLEGWGGEGLLASYQIERRPIARRIVREATESLAPLAPAAKLARIEDPTPEGDRARQEVRDTIMRERTQVFISDGLVLGYNYDGSPIVCSDGTPLRPQSVSKYEPTARPGSRAPHAWLAEGKSTLDLFGKSFVLLRFGDAPADPEPFVATARSRGVPLQVIDIPNPEIARLYECRLALIRPDGHVAWRDDEMPAAPLAVIDTVRGASEASAR